MKVETVEQYKVLNFIENNFIMDSIRLTLLDRYSIEIQDENKDTMVFYLEDDVVKFK